MNDTITKETIQKEVEFTLHYVTQDPENESPYNYIRGLIQIKSEEDKNVTLFKYSDFPFLKEKLEEIFTKNSSAYHCLGLILDIELEANNKEKCKSIYDNLIEIDFIRKKYWLWRKQKL